MNKQTGAIVVSILFALGTAAASYAAETKTKESDTTKPGQPLNTEEQKGPKSPAAPDKAAPAATEKAAPAIPSRVVTGELTKIDGKSYVVKDESGKEVKFELDQRTKMNAKPKVGDKIRVELAPQGYAQSISMASDSQQAGIPPLAKRDLPQPEQK